jgi:hypothetical protein
MPIYHGAGGAGDSTNDAVVTEVATYASQAATSATNAATSATNAASSASSASTSASNAAASATTATNAISAAQSASTLAQSYSNDASDSADEAAASAALADTYRQQAEDSKNEADTSATNAANSATTASSYVTTVQGYVTTTEGYKNSAASSQTAAATSASQAATSASSASSSASTATTKASEALTSASQAATSATSAASSASTATTKESEASTSATNAASSATSAASSASTATTQASTATTKASEAATSATNAASSASAASTSASNAAASASTATTKASEASTSATDAASSATSADSAKTAAESARDAAQAVYDNFDDRYLGAKPNDPTVDNDGNALLTGALYFNTGSGTMKVYTGSAWAAGYVTLSGALVASNNLSDLTVPADARTNIGLGNVTNESKATMFTNPTFTGTVHCNNGVQIDGDLTVSGTTVTMNTANLAVEDNMIYLNEGSTVANPDLGIAGNYNDGTYRHAGVFRDATDGKWKFFKNYVPEPDDSPYIDTSHATFALADVQANNFTGTLTGNVTGDVTGNVSGNAGTVTNGVYTSGSYSNPSWITGLSETKVLPTQSGNSGKFLTTNGTASSWTSLGTAATTSSSDYATAAQGATADTAYADRLKWDGGATGLVAATGRTSLGLGSAATTSSSDYATAAQGTKADTAYGWGNHASAGYLTSIADGSVTPAKLSTGHPTWDTSGNLGLGVTPSTWSLGKAMQIGTAGDASILGFGNQMYLSANAYYNGAWTYAANGYANRYTQASGQHQWYNAASGTAGGTISFTQAMTLDASGNLGIGTTSPGRTLELKNSVAYQLRMGDGGTYYDLGRDNGTGYFNLYGSQTGYTGYIFGGVDGERMRITTAGNVNIGSTNNVTDARLTVANSSAVGMEFSPGIAIAGENRLLSYNRSSNAYINMNYRALAHIFADSSAERARIQTGFSVGTTADPGAGAIYATGNITAYYSSDRTLKENIQDVDNALDKVCAIGSKTFDWTDEYIAAHGGEDGYFIQKSDFGVVAQDVQAVFPQAVRTRQDGTLAVDYEKLATLAFGAIKELVKRVEALEAK